MFAYAFYCYCYSEQFVFGSVDCYLSVYFFIFSCIFKFPIISIKLLMMSLCDKTISFSFAQILICVSGESQNSHTIIAFICFLVFFLVAANDRNTDENLFIQLNLICVYVCTYLAFNIIKYYDKNDFIFLFYFFFWF